MNTVENEKLITTLRGLTDAELSQFSDEELSKITTTLNATTPPPASYTESKITPQGNAAMSANPFMDPNLITNNAYEEATETDFSLDGIGSSFGGIGGGYKAADMAQKALVSAPPLVRGLGTIAAGGIGAYTGGSAGDLLESSAESYWDIDTAPDNIKDAFMQSLKEGGEEAAFDIIGNTVFQLGGAAGKFLRPQASKLGLSVKNLLNKGGSSPSLGQLTDNFMYSALEKLVRGAPIGGGPFTKLDLAQDSAIAKYTTDYIKNFTKISADNLTEKALGKLVLDVVKKGREAHSSAASGMYANLDELIPNQIIPTSTQAAPGFSQAMGAPKQVVKGFKEIGSVDMRAVKQEAINKLNKLKKSGNIGLTAEGGELLQKIVDLDDFIGFEAAHNARSDMLFRQRKLNTTQGGDPISKNLSDMIGGVDKSMDAAGKRLNPEGLKAYRQAAKFYKFGKTNFNNKIINSILKKEDVASKIAPQVFRKGNYEEIIALRRAVKVASKFDKSIVFDKVWGEMQGSYLKSLLPIGTDNVLSAPIRSLHKDKSLIKTLRGVFTKEQREGVVNMSRTIDEILSKRGSSGGLINLRQIGAVSQGFGAIAASSEGVSYGEATALIGLPILFAQIATRPTLVKKYIRWVKAKPGTALKLNAVTKLAYDLGIKVNQLDPTNATGIKETDKETDK